MAKRFSRIRWVLVAAGAAFCALPSVLAQEALVNAPEPIQPIVAPMLPDRLLDKPSQPPALTILVGQLGFSAPGAISLGQRNSVASLDFLDENRLLFTFRVPGLVHRQTGEYEERQIRAVVLTLPSGAVEAEALWTVHDRQRYLWMLKDGRFLLRDRENLDLGDAALELKPYLRFDGPLVWLEMDPTQQYLVTDSREQTATQKPASDSDLAVRVLRRDSGQVMLVSHTRSTVHLPINSDGYLENLRANGEGWLLNLHYFSGGSRILGEVDSTCSPLFDFLSQRHVLVTTCSPTGTGKLLVMTTSGRRLWEAQTSAATLWPLVIMAANGTRLVREALALDHPVSTRSTVDQSEIKGQLVEILDAADGRVELVTAASPVLDAGGNVTISPSGRRVAVLNGGTIQVFDLPPPPLLP